MKAFGVIFSLAVLQCAFALEIRIPTGVGNATTVSTLKLSASVAFNYGANITNAPLYYTKTTGSDAKDYNKNPGVDTVYMVDPMGISLVRKTQYCREAPNCLAVITRVPSGTEPGMNGFLMYGYNERTTERHAPAYDLGGTSGSSDITAFVDVLEANNGQVLISLTDNENNVWYNFLGSNADDEDHNKISAWTFISLAILYVFFCFLLIIRTIKAVMARTFYKNNKTHGFICSIIVIILSSIGGIVTFALAYATNFGSKNIDWVSNNALVDFLLFCNVSAFVVFSMRAFRLGPDSYPFNAAPLGDKIEGGPFVAGKFSDLILRNPLGPITFFVFNGLAILSLLGLLMMPFFEFSDLGFDVNYNGSLGNRATIFLAFSLPVTVIGIIVGAALLDFQHVKIYVVEKSSGITVAPGVTAGLAGKMGVTKVAYVTETKVLNFLEWLLYVHRSTVLLAIIYLKYGTLQEKYPTNPVGYFALQCLFYGLAIYHSGITLIAVTAYFRKEMQGGTVESSLKAGAGGLTTKPAYKAQRKASRSNSQSSRGSSSVIFDNGSSISPSSSEILRRNGARAIDDPNQGYEVELPEVRVSSSNGYLRLH